MRRIIFFMLIALSFPLATMAQSYDDDLYYIPKKEKDKEEKKEVAVTVHAAPGSTVIVRDGKGNVRDVDAYNRRYDAADNEFTVKDDTLYIREKAANALDGEWVGGFEGSQDDYEYAERIIRFRNPRYAIPVSSPYYWDVVYGLNSWDWNVYTDGYYAYAFPTFSNRLWWDWRWGSLGWGWGPGWHWNYGWNSWYTGSYWGWGGYWPGYWNGGWGHHHYGGGGWYPGGSGVQWANTHDATRRPNSNRVSIGDRRPGTASAVSTNRRPGSAVSSGTTGSRRPAVSNGGASTTRRVVGAREGSVGRANATRENASAETGRSVYTRPAATNTSRNAEGVRESVNRSTSVRNASGSASSNSGSYSAPSTSRSSGSVSSGSSGSSRSGVSSGGGGGSSRSNSSRR
jgi:hypothetical protein